MPDMRYELLPNGERIPVLGLGTWGMVEDSGTGRQSEERIIKAIQMAIGLGYTHIDTAEAYGEKLTEDLVGRAIKDFDRRDLFITTKVSPFNLRYSNLLQALDGSLQRLMTDYVDMYLIHWPNRRVPLDDSFRALNEAMERGLVRHVGVSNFDLNLLQESRELPANPIATNQVPYSLGDRKYVQNRVLEYCQMNGIVLTAYSPIKYGSLKHPVVREIAEKNDATPVQIALNWLVRQPKVITIPKSIDERHLRENLEALDLELGEEDIERLNLLV
jgi:diketogulonate reductase-like aldo/keto reductase